MHARDLCQRMHLGVSFVICGHKVVLEELPENQVSPCGKALRCSDSLASQQGFLVEVKHVTGPGLGSAQSKTHLVRMKNQDECLSCHDVNFSVKKTIYKRPLSPSEVRHMCIGVHFLIMLVDTMTVLWLGVGKPLYTVDRESLGYNEKNVTTLINLYSTQVCGVWVK